MTQELTGFAEVTFNGEIIAHFITSGAALDYAIALSIKYPEAEIEVLSKFIGGKRHLRAEITSRGTRTW